MNPNGKPGKFTCMPSNAQPIKRVEVGVGVLVDFDQHPWHVLITRRPETAVLAGYWEFPGGKREPDETIEACVIREFYEEVGLRVRLIQPLAPIEHTYPHAVVLLSPFICRFVSGEVRYAGVVEHKWVPVNLLTQVRFPEANAPIVDEIIQYAKLNAGFKP
jgi:A/G-specific adenine glycosylase